MTSEKPKETVTKADIKRKLDEFINETKQDIKGSSTKFVGGAAAGAAILTAISYFIGKRRGRKSSNRE